MWRGIRAIAGELNTIRNVLMNKLVVAVASVVAVFAMSVQGAEAGGALPDAYEEVPYLESTGTQYIDPDYDLAEDTRIEISFGHLKYDYHKVLFGGVIWGDGAALVNWRKEGTIGYLGAATTPTFAYDSGAGDDCTFVIVSSDQEESVFSNLTSGVSTPFTAGSIVAGARDQPFLIFTTANEGHLESSLTSYRLYSMKLGDGDALRRDLVPVRRLSDGELGLYDKVDGGFYANAGSGKFKTAGRRITYLRSNGSQYFNLGYKVGASTSADLWFGNYIKQPNGGDNKFTAIFGSTWADNSFTLSVKNNDVNHLDQFRWLGNASEVFSPDVDFTHDFRVSVTNNAFLTVYDLSKGTAECTLPAGASSAAADNLNLLYDATGGSRLKAKLDLYRFAVGSDAKGADHDYVPYLSEEGVVGLYDTVKKAFVAKTAGNDFVCGLAYDLVEGAARFTRGAFTATDMRALESGAVDYDSFEKASEGTLNTAAIAEFVRPVAISAGTWDLADGVAATQTIHTLSLEGGVTLRFDLVGTACDTIAADDITVSAADGRKVKIDVAAHSPDWGNGFRIISGGLQDGDEANFEIAGTAAYTLAVQDGCLCLFADNVPATMTWENGAWVRRNRGGAVVDAPTDAHITTLYLPQEVTAACSLAAETPVKAVVAESEGTPVVLADDVDWTGLDLVKFGSLTLDLGGHDLALSGQGGILEGEVAVTNSAEESVSTFTLAVPEAAAIDNRGLSLAGAIRFVKTGAGSFRMTRSPQNYTGGTLVSGGVLDTPAPATTDDLTYAPFEKGFVPFGPQDAVIEIGADGTFDIRGNFCYSKYTLILAGGTLRNTVDQGAVDNKWYSIGRLTLTADSTLEVTEDTRVGRKTTALAANLGGHTLDVSITSKKRLNLLNYAFTNGTVRVVKGGWFRSWMPGTAAWTDCTLDFGNAALQLDADLTVENLILRSDYTNEDGNKKGTARLYVTGVFKPVTAYYHNITLLDGVTIDLTGRGLPYVIPAAGSASTFGFADGGRFDVLLDSVPRSGTRVIDWSAQQPSNWQGLRFAGQEGCFGFEVTAEGVVLRKGLILYLR